jgi:hypothetical protein
VVRVDAEQLVVYPTERGLEAHAVLEQQKRTLERSLHGSGTLGLMRVALFQQNVRGLDGRKGPNM